MRTDQPLSQPNLRRPPRPGLRSGIAREQQRAAAQAIEADTTRGGQEWATVDHVVGNVAYVKRAGQSTAIPIDVIGGLSLAAGNSVLVERPHGSLNTAFIRTKQ